MLVEVRMYILDVHLCSLNHRFVVIVIKINKYLLCLHVRNQTNPDRNSKTMKRTFVNEEAHDAVTMTPSFRIHCTVYIWDYTGHQPALGVMDFPTSSYFCLHVGFPTWLPIQFLT